MKGIDNEILNKRRAGILLHITSLPGMQANGDLGKEAYDFVNFLHDTGISVWQTLPLGMPHEDGSPYQCLSAHAGNPALINLDWLEKKGWLQKIEHCTECKEGDSFLKNCLVSKAYNGFHQSATQREVNDFARFCQENADWLDDFVLFLALKAEFGGIDWNKWPEQFRDRDEKSLQNARLRLSECINIIKFEQYVFFCQWYELKSYAHEKGVMLFGDIPIFVAFDSADVWAHREVFKLNGNGEMSVVAGVPPDYFSETGQHWGNPHFDWEYLQQTGFKWWLDRLKTQRELFDIIRIDHFRGLESAWEIPAADDTAINGRWVKAPGKELLTAINDAFGEISLVAEDLGIITHEVEKLRDEFNLPGMKILHFAFNGDEDNPYLPFNYQSNCVVYTGTHDNDTTLGWYETLAEDENRNLHEYLGKFQTGINWALMETAFSSVANLAIVPFQDVLNLGSEHRMNTPGTVGGNWQWRFSWDQLTEDTSKTLAHMVSLYGRRH